MKIVLFLIFSLFLILISTKSSNSKVFDLRTIEPNLMNAKQEEPKKKVIAREWIIRTIDLNSAKLIAQRHDLFVDQDYFQYYKGFFLLKEKNIPTSNQEKSFERQIDEVTSLLKKDEQVSLVLPPTEVNIEIYDKIKPQKKDLPIQTDPSLIEEYYLYQLNVPRVWDKHNVTGRGVKIVIILDELEITHPDFANNYDPSLSKDYLVGQEITPLDLFSTSIAGIIASENNNICGIGIAYQSKISFRNPFSTSSSLVNLMDSLTYKSDESPVLSNSWSFNNIYLLGQNTILSGLIDDIVKTGRGGLGNIIIFAAGDFRTSQGNTNYNILQAAPQVIVVASIGPNYKFSSFSTPGFSILCTAPGEYIVTTDRTGTNGFSTTDCTSPSIVPSTTFSTPMITGIVSLILEANPRLNWQEVQSILIESCNKIDYTNPTWFRNGAGYQYSSDYGFGLPDAERAVSLAKQWKLTDLRNSFNFTKTGNMTIPEAGSPNSLVESKIFVHQRTKVHRARIFLDVQHQQLTDLEITLTSPRGTKSVLAQNHGNIELIQTFTVKEFNNLSYGVFRGNFGSTYNYDVEGQLVVASPSTGCDPFDNPSNFIGKIVFVQSFYICPPNQIVKNAQGAGAIAVIFLSQLPLGNDPTITIPSFVIFGDIFNNDLYSRLLGGETFNVKFQSAQTKNQNVVSTELINFPMSTLATYGEDAYGAWVLEIEDKFNDTLVTPTISPKLISWKLEIFPFENVMSEEDTNDNNNGYYNDNYSHQNNHNN